MIIFMKGMVLFMTQKDIDRINELAKKAKVSTLTEDEKLEQTELRNQYRRDFLGSLSGHLDNMTIVNPDGSKERVKDRKKD